MPRSVKSPCNDSDPRPSCPPEMRDKAVQAGLSRRIKGQSRAGAVADTQAVDVEYRSDIIPSSFLLSLHCSDIKCA